MSDFVKPITVLYRCISGKKPVLEPAKETDYKCVPTPLNDWMMKAKFEWSKQGPEARKTGWRDDEDGWRLQRCPPVDVMFAVLVHRQASS